MSEISLKPIVDTNGNHVLWDVYKDGKWLGSRRTSEQCYQVFGVSDHLQNTNNVFKVYLGTENVRKS